MNFFSPIFAQADGGSDAAGWSSMGDEVRNRLITFGAYALVMVVILVWAIFIRKQRNKRKRIHRRKPHTWQLSEDEKGRRHHRRHRSKIPELPKNPNRAETGGLPPRRPDAVQPPGP